MGRAATYHGLPGSLTIRLGYIIPKNQAVSVPQFEQLPVSFALRSRDCDFIADAFDLRNVPNNVDRIEVVHVVIKQVCAHFCWSGASYGLLISRKFPVLQPPVPSRSYQR